MDERRISRNAGAVIVMFFMGSQSGDAIFQSSIASPPLLSIPIVRRREVIFRKSGGERLWLHRYKKRDLEHAAEDSSQCTGQALNLFARRLAQPMRGCASTRQLSSPLARKA